jgi:isopenicillin N synthase-like dioxygenase
MQLHITNSRNHLGYFEIGRENFDPSIYEQGDYKEGFHIGRDLSVADAEFDMPLGGANQWPQALPEFKQVMSAYFDACLMLGISLMRAFAIALALPEKFFDRYYDKPLPTLRLLRYPSQSSCVSKAQIGCGEHTDFGCLTILAQDGVGGLQVKNQHGKWISAPAIDNALLVNVGDMLARWSNDRFVAAPHRVVNISEHDRYSLPFFLDPNFDADLTVLPTCTSETNPARYAPTTAGRYLLERIASTRPPSQ